MRLITDWFKRTFSDPQIVFLTLILAIGFAVVLFMGDMLAPVLASAVIAYLLEGLVVVFEDRGVPRLLAVTIVFVAFVLFLTAVMFGLMPLLSRQVTELAQQLPNIIGAGQQVGCHLHAPLHEVVGRCRAGQFPEALGECRPAQACATGEVLQAPWPGRCLMDRGQ